MRSECRIHASDKSVPSPAAVPTRLSGALAAHPIALARFDASAAVKAEGALALREGVCWE